MSRSIDAWLFGAGSGARMHGAITVLAVVIGLRVALGPYRQLVGQPDVLFDPPWFLSWLDGMPGTTVITVLQVAGAVAALAAACNRYRRLSFAIAWVCLLVLGGLRASRGKIQHNDVMLLLAAVPFLAAVTDTTWRDARHGPQYGWPPRAGMVVVAIAYFVSGLAKVVSSGTAWVFSDNMTNILYDGARSPKSHAGDLARWIGDQGALARTIAAATIAYELAFPLALRFARSRPFFVAGAVVLHASIFVLLGLDYSAWVGTVLALFVPWERVYSTVMARSGQLSTPMRA